MSKEFEKKIEELFLHDQKILDSNSLKQIIFESLNMSSIKEQTENVDLISSEDIMKFLPKFEFTEDVGTISSEDQKQFQNFFGPTLKAKKTIEEKINYLSSFSTNITKRSTSNILSGLMMLKVLQNMISKASPGAAGLQTEAFIAGLMGGEQIKRNVSLNVIDVVIGSKPYQIKVLSPDKNITMSSKNVKDHFINNNFLNFLIVIKTSMEQLDFYSFTLDKEKIEKNEKFKSMLEMDKTFIIKMGEDGKYLNIKHLGEIKINKEIFNQYNLLLQNNVKDVLTQTANLINNINLFYIQNRPSAAGAGIANANNVATLLKQQ